MTETGPLPGDDDLDDELEEPSGDNEGGSTTKSTTPTVRPKRVPRDSLAKAEELAVELYNFAGDGSTSAEAFASKLGHDLSSGGSSTWDNKLALLRAWGLVAPQGDLQLTDIGKSIIRVDNPNQQATARLAAFRHSKPFSELAESYSGMQLPNEADLATKVRFDFSLKEVHAPKVARVFAESLAHAGLVESTGKVSSEPNGSRADRLVGNGGEEKDSDDGTGTGDLKVDDLALAGESTGSSSDVEPDGVGPPDGEDDAEAFGAGSVDMQVDPEAPGAVEIRISLRGFDVAGVERILRTIGYDRRS